MGVKFKDPRDGFIDLIDIEKSRVQLEPHVVFVCGGPVDVKTTKNHSIRNMFMNLSGAVGGIADGFVLAENFKDWEQGYSNLSDFENDIAFLSSMIVIFLESEGALTEFGLFFGNSMIRDKLVVVVHKEFHKSESFIDYGLLRPMEAKSQSSVKVFTIDHRDIESVDEDEVKEILDDIIEDCEFKDKTLQFNALNRGHQIFLILQVVILFQALTKIEIRQYIERLYVPILPKEIDSALYILQKFNFVILEKRSSQYFYVAVKNLASRVNLSFKKDVGRRYDAAAIKIAVDEFYVAAQESDRTHRRRVSILSSLRAEW